MVFNGPWWTRATGAGTGQVTARAKHGTKYGVCDEGGLELGENTNPRMTMEKNLKIIGSKPITYKNPFCLINWVLLSEMQVKYVEDIIVTINTGKVGVASKEVIQLISDIGQVNYYLQADNYLDYLIW